MEFHDSQNMQIRHSSIKNPCKCLQINLIQCILQVVHSCIQIHLDVSSEYFSIEGQIKAVADFVV